jgi:(p)ppGpp synthase/HD superfamily hydrolase
MKFQAYLNEISLDHAFSFADELHKGQFRKGSGAPYITHPVSAYRILRKLKIKDREILTATILHDTLEDTPTTYNEIKKEFGTAVADLVKEVTSMDKMLQIMGKPNYLADKMIKMSDKALTIKLADRYHNIIDMKSSSKGFIEKTLNQTYFILKRLRNDRNLNKNHKKLISLINKEMDKHEI